MCVVEGCRKVILTGNVEGRGICFIIGILNVWWHIFLSILGHNDGFVGRKESVGGEISE